MKTITFGSVCSGIEAASVAWHSLGWRAAWLAEIERFPSAVLAHHYPDVPNLGDMTKIAAMVRSGAVAAPDVLVGGTPCQAFSIAGLRNSLGDARGQLSLSFVDLANAIDTARLIRGDNAAAILWENVPGVLSTSDNAFGCFLGALSGEDEPVVPPGKKWSNAGCVFGPQRTVAWRVLDAQYFGVAQRRRRVFVVASARDGFDPAAVLFERDGLRRDIAPSREAREDVAGTLASRTGGGGFPGSDESCSGYVQPVYCLAHGQGGAELGIDRAPTLTCNHEAPILARTLLKGGHSNNPLDETLITTRSVAFAQNSRDEVSLMGGDGQIVGALAAQPGMKQTCYVAQAMMETTWDSQEKRIHDLRRGVSPTLSARCSGGGTSDGYWTAPGMAVRRLTPKECARLQAFPDDYLSQVIIRNKPAADGPMYKALGNSMCVKNMAWLGRRISIEMEAA